MSALGAASNNPTEPLILVDGQDREIGYSSKEECHRGAGILHRAFSIFLFNREGQLLLQQRSGEKPLWPLYWSNSCCSHPRRGEPVEVAARRRVREELNLSCQPAFLYKFEYRAEFDDIGTEHELCWVYAAWIDGMPVANAGEVADWRFVSPAALTADIAAAPERYTPWLKLEWAEITARHLDRMLAAVPTNSRD